MSYGVKHPNNRRMEMTEFQRECFEYYWSLGPDRKLITVANHFRKSQQAAGVPENTNFPYRNIDCNSANGRQLVNYDTIKIWAERWQWREKVMKRNDVFENELNHRLAERFAKDAEKFYELMRNKMLTESGNIKLERMRDWKDFFTAMSKMKKLVKDEDEDEVPNLPTFNLVLNSQHKVNDGGNSKPYDTAKPVTDAGSVPVKQKDI